MRGGAVAARRAHNPKVAGSSPAPATKYQSKIAGFAYLANPAIFDSENLQWQGYVKS